MILLMDTRYRIHRNREFIFIVYSTNSITLIKYHKIENFFEQTKHSRNLFVNLYLISITQSLN